jgi:hypothetical protein
MIEERGEHSYIQWEQYAGMTGHFNIAILCNAFVKPCNVFLIVVFLPSCKFHQLDFMNATKSNLALGKQCGRGVSGVEERLGDCVRLKN